jgi:ketosteroid isomerase-like protein
LSDGDVDPRIKVAEHLYGAIAAGDLDEAFRWAHPDIILDWSRSRGPYQGTYEGHQGAKDFVTEAITVFRDVEYFTEEWIPVEERLVRVGGLRGVGRSSGVEISGRGAQIFEFADGLVSRVTLYQTREEALAAGELEG